MGLVTRHLTRRRLRFALGALLLGFVAVNALAYRHAGAMLTYQRGATRPPAETAWQTAKLLVGGVTMPRPENPLTPAGCDVVRFTAGDGTNLEAGFTAVPTARGTVILFPAYGGARSSLDAEAHVFRERNFNTLAVDFRGTGGSDGDDTSLGFHEAADVAAALGLAESRDLPRPLILYGRSLGGAAMLRAIAVRGVKPDGVIVESVFADALAAVRNRFRLLGLPSFPGAELLAFWGGVRIGVPGFTHAPSEYAKACDCRALVLHGVDDRHALVAEGEANFANLQGDKTWVPFDGAGHGPLLAANSAKWRAAVREFLVRE